MVATGLAERAKISIMMQRWERYDEPLATWPVFWRRVIRRIGLTIIPLVLSLTVGCVGYMWLAGLGPVDAFLNASMILGGMGPVDALPNDAAKIFAGVYALYSGVFFLVVAGVILSPFLHRVMHLLHVPDDDDGSSSDKSIGPGNDS